MYLESERLVIRKFTLDDLEAVHEYTSNPMVMKYIPEGVMTMKETNHFIRENLGCDAEKFAVRLKEGNLLIGHIAFFKYFGDHTYEIGWVFNPKYYNKGYATEAADAIIDYGFSKLKLHRIIATCQPENIPSYRIMEKVGMRREGYFKKCIPYGTEWWDEYYYAILGEEWALLKG